MASAGGGNLLTSTTIGATGNGGEPHGTSQEWEGKSLLHELDDEVVDLRRQIAELRVERKAQCEVQTAQAERLVMMNQQVEQAQADEDSARSESSRLASQLRMRESELSAERKRAETLESQANSLYARALEMSATHTACEEARLAATREAEELRRKLDAATATLREKRSEAERLEKARSSVESTHAARDRQTDAEVSGFRAERRRLQDTVAAAEARQSELQRALFAERERHAETSTALRSLAHSLRTHPPASGGDGTTVAKLEAGVTEDSSSVPLAAFTQLQREVTHLRDLTARARAVSGGGGGGTPARLTPARLPAPAAQPTPSPALARGSRDHRMSPAGVAPSPRPAAPLTPTYAPAPTSTPTSEPKKRPKPESKEKQLRRAFSHIDVDGSGACSKRELYEALKTVGTTALGE